MIMKKYILLIGLLFCFLYQPNAKQNQDSTWVNKGKLVLPDMGELQDRLNDLQFDFDFDTQDLSNMQMHFDSLGVALAENLGDLKVPGVKFNHNFNFGKDVSSPKEDKDNRENKEPTRIEHKSFQNITEIEFFHKYGNIIVQESNSKQVDLEIRYFDKRNQKGSATITTTNKLLTISTNSTGKSNSDTKIDYIISVPKNTLLNMDIKYGNIKIGKFDGHFNADLSYSNLRAQSLTTQSPVIKAKYSEVNIDEARDLNISGSYSNFKIKKANKIDVKGNYNNYYFDNVQILNTGKDSSYGDLVLGTVGSMEGGLKYADVVIENLLSGIDISTAYGDVTIKSISAQAKVINIKASYADIAITIPTNLSATFDVRTTYGDFNVSKRYTVKYTESKETNTSVSKKGQIGTGNPTANIVVTNSYADIDIR